MSDLMGQRVAVPVVHVRTGGARHGPQVEEDEVRRPGLLVPSGYVRVPGVELRMRQVAGSVQAPNPNEPPRELSHRYTCMAAGMSSPGGIVLRVMVDMADWQLLAHFRFTWTTTLSVEKRMFAAGHRLSRVAHLHGAQGAAAHSTPLLGDCAPENASFSTAVCAV